MPLIARNKIFSQLTLSILLIGSTFSSFAIDRGVNYDPDHSIAYLNAQRANNLNRMRINVTLDLNKIKQQGGFAVVRTFNSRYSTIDGAGSGTFADIACPMGIKLMLGVYEFRNPVDQCESWCESATDKEVQDAIDSAIKYPNCIVGIVVGNEDITNWDSTVRLEGMERRILHDVKEIKNALNSTYRIPVGTAQRDDAYIKLAGYGDELSKDLIASLDYIGANILPYWDKEKYNEPESHAIFISRYQALSETFTQPVIVTEEGWPSESNQFQNPNASLGREKNYYFWWRNRAQTDTFSSYYLSAFDNIPTDGDKGASIYFGLCQATGANKVLPC